MVEIVSIYQDEESSVLPTHTTIILFEHGRSKTSLDGNGRREIRGRIPDSRVQPSAMPAENAVVRCAGCPRQSSLQMHDHFIHHCRETSMSVWRSCGSCSRAWTRASLHGVPHDAGRRRIIRPHPAVPAQIVIPGLVRRSAGSPWCGPGCRP